jgi:hypothetical protein
MFPEYSVTYVPGCSVDDTSLTAFWQRYFMPHDSWQNRSPHSANSPEPKGPHGA